MIIKDIRARKTSIAGQLFTRDNFICCEAKVYIHKDEWIKFLDKYSDCSLLVNLEEERAIYTTKS